MKSAPLPSDELARQRALQDLHLLDTPAEQEFDDITLLASFICETPIALISLVDKDRQWFKSRVGLDIPETPRDIALCAHAILGDEIFEVVDAAADERFKDNPVVTGDLHLRFYAGVPLKTLDNHNVGTLCVIDRKPRQLTDAQRAALKALGRQIMRLVELRKSTRLQDELRRKLSAETALTRAIIENAGAAIISTDLDSTILTFNPAAEQMLGYSADEVIGKVSPVSFHDPGEVAERAAELSAHYGEKVSGLDVFLRPLRDQAADTVEWTYIAKDGRRIPILLTMSVLRDEAGQPFGYLGIIRDLGEAKARTHRLEAAARLGDIVRRSQESFITGGPTNQMFDRLLTDILEYTRSEYGFIGEVLYDENGAPFLKTHAITNIAWNEATRKLYEESKATGFIFRNLHTLFGAALTTGEPVIANRPATDPRRGGLPQGHPAMHAFLGLPIHYGGNLVGLVGVANRPGGYDDEFVRELAPMAASCAALIHAMRLDVERSATRQSLVREQDRFRLIVDTATEAFIEVAEDGTVTEWNQHAAEAFRAPVADAVGRQIDDLVMLRGEDGHDSGLRDHVPTELERPGQPREFTFRCADGTQFQGELVMWAMPEGSERRYCAFIRDVTERRELEKQQRLRFESETLLKEIHHRVKNNMQVISSLLSIQSSQLKDDQRDVFLECRERIRAMSLIHDRLYSTGKYAGIDFADYLREMVALITSSNRPAGAEVHVDLQLQPVEVELDKAVPLSLIASELVLNSLKHAFRDRSEGTLTVRLGNKDGTCRLFVGDDGPGMQPASTERAGVGLQLIEGLARQIKARREVSAGPGLGTTILWEQ
ncbi:MAG: PAS domain S-box protein [Chthoniobacterales bacterium]|nr:PAS domain S-box protein [Chthoniobacterales bacterium]